MGPKRRDLLFLFCPSNLTAPSKSHHPPLVIPSAAEFPATLLRDTSTCAVFRRRKPHEARQRHQHQQEIRQAEGSAVRPGSSTKVSVPLVLPQNRHPKQVCARWTASWITLSRPYGSLSHSKVRGIGRVPQVRHSVPGPKTMGRSPTIAFVQPRKSGFG